MQKKSKEKMKERKENFTNPYTKRILNSKNVIECLILQNI